ncbi:MULTISPECIES: GNAT family N-acetyltransferase [unclassified Ensifer]|uniref:GNAT family N-acetyltransferase n=1 Tax=unclassified Ensifer TaxID=2633371 RepID=UPI000812D098|nr:MULTISPECIES: GNAT family N-acetyltransferase [unclassified Ensifer]OCP09204.1 acetyltransferase [Ensifer sp. LC13]OCP10390.1 acetyltransferase [Ensifer sp. LC11]OCP14008.1 acetyltransferase [Ensifer sp. LC14]OCP32451.1 acetyltransferase [Ensifer sp. LC499]
MSRSTLTIRAASAGDLPGLLALYSELNPDDPVLDAALAADRFAAIDAQPGMTIFIGFAGGIAAASVSLVIVPNLTRGAAPYALVENVVTAAAFRRKGFAGALIRHAIAKAWDSGCYKVMLLTGSKDPATLRFYENCGFKQDKTGYQVRRP